MNIMRHAALLLLLLAAARLGDARQQPQSHLSTHPAVTDARLPWELYTGCAKEPVNPVQVAAIRTKRQPAQRGEELTIQLGDNLLEKHFYGGSQTAADISRTVAERLDPIDGIYAQVHVARINNRDNRGELPNNFRPPTRFTLLLEDVERGTQIPFERTVRNRQELYQSRRTFRALEYGLNNEGVYEFKGESELNLELPRNIVENAMGTINHWARLNHFQSNDPNRRFVTNSPFNENEMTTGLNQELLRRQQHRDVMLKHELLMADLRKNYNKPLRPVNPPERPNPHSQPRGSAQERIKSPEDGSDSKAKEKLRARSKSCESKDVRVTPSRKDCSPENDREGDDANQEAKEANDANNDGVNDNGNGNDNDNENDGNYERGD